MRESFLDTLPESPAGALKELMDYQFTNPAAQQASPPGALRSNALPRTSHRPSSISAATRAGQPGL